jgi:hypothetical protein
LIELLGEENHDEGLWLHVGRTLQRADDGSGGQETGAQRAGGREEPAIGAGDVGRTLDVKLAVPLA